MARIWLSLNLVRTHVAEMPHLVKADKATHPAQIDFLRADAVVFRPNGLPSNLQQTGTVSLIILDPNTPELDPKSDA